MPELIKTDERWLLQTMNPLTFLKHGHVFVMMRPQDGRWLDGQHWNAKRGETKKKNPASMSPPAVALTVRSSSLPPADGGLRKRWGGRRKERNGARR